MGALQALRERLQALSWRTGLAPEDARRIVKQGKRAAKQGRSAKVTVWRELQKYSQGA